MKKTIGIIGGDERSIWLRECLEQEGYVVKTFGVVNDDYTDLSEFLLGVTYVVSGIPFSRDDYTINMPNCTNKVSIENLFNSMKECKTLIAGSFSSNVKLLAQKHDIKLYDFLDDEDFAIYNAIPTAEGAIKIAVEEHSGTIHSSNCLILGFGRIGKVLADMLNGLHANVYVAARKQEDLVWIKTLGYIPILYKDLSSELPKIDILFNTVPSLLIRKEELILMKKDSLIIDLASKPGGIDFEEARKLGIKTNWALGLPGKVSPKSVATYMMEKLKNID